MALVLDGTNGVSGVDGTASNPAIEGTDSNTGIFYPAADTVAIGTGGTEALRVNSSQNVGIGTTSPTARLTVVTGAAGNNEGEIRLSENATYYAGLRRVNATDEFRIGSYGASQNITFYTVSSERMRLDASGLVQIGTTTAASAATALTLYRNATETEFFIQNSTTGTGSNGFRILSTGNNVYVTNKEAGFIAFETSDTERARITSDGNFGLGAVPSSWGSNYKSIESTGASGAYFVCNNVNECGIGSNMYATNSAFVRTTTGAASMIRANNGQIQTYTTASGNAGTNITFTSGPYVANLGTSWTNSSDERLKNITGEIQNGVQKVMSLRAAEFTWKDGGNNKPQVGLIAQDLLTVLPEVVVVPESEIDSQGNQTFLGVNYDQVIPLLVAAIKEQQAMIDELKAKVAALENA